MDLSTYQWIALIAVILLIFSAAGMIACIYQWMTDSFERHQMATYVDRKWQREAESLQDAIDQLEHELDLDEQYEQTTIRG